MQDWAAVQRVYKQTHSKRKTAEILGISRNTVKKLLELDEEPVYQRNDYKSCIDEYKELIIEWRCKPFEFNGTRIFRELVKKGYTGSIGPVYRFLRKVDEDIESISSKATERVETPVGDQAQFDWSEYSMVVGGRERKVYCFAMILAASRKKAVCFSLKVDASAIYEAIQELLRRKAETEEKDLNPQMPAVISFIREECLRQKKISDAAPDDHRRDYGELNEAFRKVVRLSGEEPVRG